MRRLGGAGTPSLSWTKRFEKRFNLNTIIFSLTRSSFECGRHDGGGVHDGADTR